MFDFIKNLFRGSPNNPQIIHKEKCFGMKVTHLLLLAEFVRAKSMEKIGPDWESFLNEPPQKVINKFISNGFLIQCSLACKLDLTYKVADLKLFLKDRGLLISGKKDVLIERLIEADYQGMKSIVNDIYECSPSARNLVEKYKAKKEIEKNKVVNDVLKYILSKDIKKSCQIATSYQEQQTTYVPKRQLALTLKASLETNIEFIKVIVNASPKILDGISQRDLNALRLWAALFFLFGPNKAGENLIDGFVGIPKFDPSTAKNMMIFFAYRQINLEKFRRLGVKKASITSCCRCPECKAIADKIMPIDKLPELPYAGCTFINGCSCSLYPIFT
jgi:hypothetical protein